MLSLKALAVGGEGSIPASGWVMLNISSSSAFICNIPKKQAAYNASKAAVRMLSKVRARGVAITELLRLATTIGLANANEVHLS